MSLLTISETLIHCFTFVGPDGCLKQGMRSGDKLYSYVASFPAAYQNRAYALACGLAEYDQHVVLTDSDSGYNVWKELRSLHQPASTESQKPSLSV